MLVISRHLRVRIVNLSLHIALKHFKVAFACLKAVGKQNAVPLAMPISRCHGPQTLRRIRRLVLEAAQSRAALGRDSKVSSRPRLNQLIPTPTRVASPSEKRRPPTAQDGT